MEYQFKNNAEYKMARKGIVKFFDYRVEFPLVGKYYIIDKLN